MSINRADNFIASLGIEAYRVGGSVRDEILGREPKDADYVVRGVSLGELWGILRGTSMERYSVTPLVLRDGQQGGFRVGRPINAEIMLPRKDISTGPGHGDFQLIIDPNLLLAEDAKRRDFTWNAIYKIIWHPDGLRTQVAGPGGVIYENLVDPLGGLEDLARRRVMVTYPHSFRDDPLRTLRALRFVSTLGYDLADQTRLSMLAYAPDVDGLTFNGHTSGTVYSEMSKLLMGPGVAAALREARFTGVLVRAFPELEPMVGFAQESQYHDMTTDEHTFKALETAAKVEAPLVVRWALLFHDSGKPDSAWLGEDGRLHYYAKGQFEDHAITGERRWRLAAERMNVPKDVRETVATIIREHMLPVSGRFRPSSVRRKRIKLGDEVLRHVIMHRACDFCGKGRPDKNLLARLARMEEVRAAAEADGIPRKVGDLRVDGKDAAVKGYRGREIGEALMALLNTVASQPNERTLGREWQLEQL